MLPSAFDILQYIFSCRTMAIYDLPINLRYIYKRVSPLVPTLPPHSLTRIRSFGPAVRREAIAFWCSFPKFSHILRSLQDHGNEHPGIFDVRNLVFLQLEVYGSSRWALTSSMSSIHWHTKNCPNTSKKCPQKIQLLSLTGLFWTQPKKLETQKIKQSNPYNTPHTPSTITISP